MFRELYYWVYILYSKRKGKRFKGKETTYASWVMTGLMSLNLIVLQGFIDYLCILKWHFSFFKFLFPTRHKTVKEFIFAILLLSPVFLYVHFNLDGKKKEIIKHFKEKKMTQFRQDWGILFFWLYVVFSIIFVFIFGFMHRNLIREVGM